MNRIDVQGPVVQRVDNAIHRINHYPAEKNDNKTKYTIHWIVIYPVDRVIRSLKIDNKSRYV